MRLESEKRYLSTLEQHFVEGKWKIIKVYVRGELHEMTVRCIEGLAP